jgi:hypothetical protein
MLVPKCICFALHSLSSLHKVGRLKVIYLVWGVLGNYYTSINHKEKLLQADLDKTLSQIAVFVVTFVRI